MEERPSSSARVRTWRDYKNCMLEPWASRIAGSGERTLERTHDHQSARFPSQRNRRRSSSCIVCSCTVSLERLQDNSVMTGTAISQIHQTTLWYGDGSPPAEISEASSAERESCSFKKTESQATPSPRFPEKPNETDEPRAITLATFPRWRSSTARQGTKVNSFDFSMTANLPLARRTDRR